MNQKMINILVSYLVYSIIMFTFLWAVNISFAEMIIYYMFSTAVLSLYVSYRVIKDKISDYECTRVVYYENENENECTYELV